MGQLKKESAFSPDSPYQPPHAGLSIRKRRRRGVYHPATEHNQAQSAAERLPPQPSLIIRRRDFRPRNRQSPAKALASGLLRQTKKLPTPLPCGRKADALRPSSLATTKKNPRIERLLTGQAGAFFILESKKPRPQFPAARDLYEKFVFSPYLRRRRANKPIKPSKLSVAVAGSGTTEERSYAFPP